MYYRRTPCVAADCKGEQNGAVGFRSNVGLINSRMPIGKGNTIVGVVTVLMNVRNGIFSINNPTPRRDIYFVAAAVIVTLVVVSPGSKMKKPEENPTLPFCFDFHVEHILRRPIMRTPMFGGGKLHRTVILTCKLSVDVELGRWRSDANADLACPAVDVASVQRPPVARARARRPLGATILSKNRKSTQQQE